MQLQPDLATRHVLTAHSCAPTGAFCLNASTLLHIQRLTSVTASRLAMGTWPTTSPGQSEIGGPKLSLACR